MVYDNPQHIVNHNQHMEMEVKKYMKQCGQQQPVTNHVELLQAQPLRSALLVSFSCFSGPRNSRREVVILTFVLFRSMTFVHPTTVLPVCFPPKLCSGSITVVNLKIIVQLCRCARKNEHILLAVVSSCIRNDRDNIYRQYLCNIYTTSGTGSLLMYVSTGGPTPPRFGLE